MLLIEDHPELIALTAAFLREQGFDVRSALSGREGLELAPHFKPQLTVCDLNLPDLSGRDVIRALRSNPLTRDTYAVVLTALSGAEIRELNDQAQTMGIDEFLSKPLTRDAVRLLIPKLKGS